MILLVTKATTIAQKQVKIYDFDSYCRKRTIAQNILMSFSFKRRISTHAINALLRSYPFED